mgnify:CR=1 FL=1
MHQHTRHAAMAFTSASVSPSTAYGSPNIPVTPYRRLRLSVKADCVFDTSVRAMSFALAFVWMGNFSAISAMISDALRPFTDSRSI